MTDSTNRLNASSKVPKKYAAARPGHKENSEQQNDKDSLLNMLSLRDQQKVIHEYNLKKPQPTIAALATKYKVSPRHISDIISNQKAILKSLNSSEPSEMQHSGSQRQEQIDFLDLVMYEYLQRTLYHKIPVDDKMFRNKADEVKDCTAILRFKASHAWFLNFKNKYGLKDLNIETLRQEIQLKEAKRSSLEPVDMVRYVQQRKKEFIEAQKNPQSTFEEDEGTPTTVSNVDKKRNKGDETKRQLRKNRPKVVYEKDDDDDNEEGGDEDLDSMTSQDDNAGNVNVDQPTIKIELNPTELSEYKAPSLPVAQNDNAKSTSNKKHRDLSKVKPTKETSRKADLSKIVLDDEREDEVYLTVYKIVDDEDNASPSADSNRRTKSSPLIKTAVDGNLPLTISSSKTEKPKTVTPNITDDITIKAEPMDTFDNQSSSSAIVPEGISIKREPSPLPQINEGIRPTNVLEGGKVFITENNKGTNLPALDHIKEEAIKPTIIFENPEESVMETYNGNTNSQRSTAGKRPRCSSPLPDVDTLEEVLQHLKVVENYVILKENFRAIGLINQLEDVIKKTPKP